MKIATRLKLGSLLCAVVVALVGAILLSTTTQVRRELNKNQSADEILNAVTALRYLSLEYGLRSEQRVFAQWRLRSASLAVLLASDSTFSGADDAARIASLRDSFASVGRLFSLLVATRAQPADEVRDELASRLTGQISGKTQTMIADAMHLSERSRQGVLASQQREIGAVAAFGAIVLATIVAGSLLTLRSLVRPLERLHEGTRKVGAGDLDFKLGWHGRDELGELASAFDSMTDALKQSTVSRLDLSAANQALQAEIAERELAERKVRSQLARLSLLQQITRSVGERQDMRSIFQVVIRSLEEQLPVDFCCICLYRKGSAALEVSCVGLRSAALAEEFAMREHARIEVGQNGLSRCVAGELVYEPDVVDVPFPFPQRLAGGGLRALVMAPLLVESTVFGVLVTARLAPSSFSSGECEFLRQLSEHVALAANQTELYGALQRAYEDLRQSQKTAVQQERLRALGQMASGIAHDINNAISPVALYTESLLETEPGLSGKARACLEVIKRAIDDVAATVARMREFYRQREPQVHLARVDANRLMQEVADLTRARWSDMPQQRGIVIALRCNFEARLPPLQGIESEIREALTNLVFNAVDAMPEGGTLTLGTRSMPASGAVAAEVWLEVGDSGVGMDEDTRRRCLEPFFTTKGERGTGLGLAMVYGMVERHGARIDIESARARGTTMRLAFPLPAEVAGAAPPQAPARRSAPLRILTVDDDPLVQKALRTVLESDGHQVSAADGGQAGIEQFRAALHGGVPYALVITDLGMPHVDGRRVAAAVKTMAPLTPVILLTGWGQRIATEDDLPADVNLVLSKPPKLHELREALAACVPDGDTDHAGTS
ncbi:HAMP domain-containing protein [Massilia sp. CCM 8733]|uniref:histidine kinase n=1 Tax=Massilia mucilaginosa TaxID=2609282 RepID=A0ABX0P273_9BURK|nr:ATP-binding protein [Massilia mucilaginosa]NHZ93049.1 HAMP domain-containing protein [Massilia mucilaginosa]